MLYLHPDIQIQQVYFSLKFTFSIYFKKIVLFGVKVKIHVQRFRITRIFCNIYISLTCLTIFN